MIYAVYSTISDGEVSLTPGLWVTQVQLNGENTLGVQSLQAPMVTFDPGKKIDPELVDMDWYAGQVTGSELTVTFDGDMSNAINATISGMNLNLVKLSDIVPTLEEFMESSYEVMDANGIHYRTVKEVIDHYGGSIEAGMIDGLSGIRFIDDSINLICILFDSGLLGGIHFTAGIYYHSELSHLGIYLSSLTIPYVADNKVLVKIPEKYLPSMSQYATKDDLATLAAQISALNATLQNALEGAE